ncbi:MAG: putative lipid II flippase FtsW [Candidatus Ryanbacteria bacterium CG10_big_fil_rev_8_21_14_0_10_43_42]|uniref:Probable peptidoglycan glycosyltransferase FtsW n=1 Tax=Candidatus Ryanbacteria bacterium CG10_big_fil_rev_8_21_14_0_10_43_42 TaxID=1974864 RepID=A0A2M8KW57_9BACT|nr:MAG: putative lipid II flippase FtsW [Candidatus Ryanbacteria bacterium CG10_big_fil_rev_8_21_14_0_10_43_42]
MSSTHQHQPDYILLGTTVLFVIVGLFIIASASPILGSSRFGEEYYYLSNQAIGAGIGVVALILGSKIRYQYWKKLAPVLLIGALFMMILVFIPNIGLELKGASRWIKVGPITIQPAEITKLAFIIYLAAWIETKKKDIASFSMGFLPFLVMLGIVSVFFVLQPDIGTLGILVITSILLFFIGGGRMSQIALLLLLGVAVLGLIIYFQPYRRDRLAVFLHPKEDTQGIGYQLHQGLIAIGSGGIFGRGFGMSRQKFNYVPEPAGDSIFAIFGEEFGFIGSVILTAMFLIFFWRGMRISARAPDGFSHTLAAGITLLIIVQAFTNIGAITGLLPLTGLPLTFISFGSSALIMNLASVGILMNISKYTR